MARATLLLLGFKTHINAQRPEVKRMRLPTERNQTRCLIPMTTPHREKRFDDTLGGTFNN
eukprot:2274683-Amphidinium_carterae.2